MSIVGVKYLKSIFISAFFIGQKFIIKNTVKSLILGSSNKPIYILENYGSSNNHFEKVMIFINMNHSSDDIKMGVICGEKNSTYIPVLKKVCIVKQILNENEKKNIIKRIAIIENEIEQIKKITVP